MVTEEQGQEPVLNVEETVEGNSLVDNAGEQQSEQQTTEASTEDQAQEEITFDPKAFAASDDNTETESSVDNKEEGEVTNGDSNNESEDDFAWPDLPDVPSDDTDSTSVGDTQATDNQDTTEATESTQATELSEDQFKSFVSELGLEANNMDDLKKVMNDLVEENSRLKEEATYGNATNKKIDDLQNFLKLDDEKLVRKSLEADGLTGEQLDDTVDKYMDTGLLNVEALKIRKTLEKAIQSERQSIQQADQAEVAKQQADREQAVKTFSEYMQSTDSLYGFKLTGNPENLPKVRSNHIDYVTSGKFFNEITSSEQNLAESSWLWRNREVLKKAMANSGRQEGRREILDQIGKPDKPKSNIVDSPIDTGEFNPKKFMQG
jgi:hypothetical protein